jgi:hypothetical protein
MQRARAKSKDCPPVAPRDKYDIEMDRESVKHGNVDPRNQPALPPEKVACVNTQD